MIDVCLLGTGGMMPLPRRYLTSLLVRTGGHSLLIDCGEGTQIALRKKGWSFKPVSTILLTHFHADHIAGLPGFFLTMGNAERTEPVTVVGPKGVERVIAAVRVLAPELPFEIKCHELTEMEEHFAAGSLLVDAFRVRHNITCYGYRLSLPRAGKFDVTKATENKVPMKCWSRLQKGETVTMDGRTFTPDMVLGEERKGLSLTYTTDTRPAPRIETYAKGSDLFICEGMYGEAEKLEKAREHRHMMIQEAALLARRAETGELWLTHYSPSMLYPADFKEETLRIFPRTVFSKDGQTKELVFGGDDEKD